MSLGSVHFRLPRDLRIKDLKIDTDCKRGRGGLTKALLSVMGSFEKSDIVGNPPARACTHPCLRFIFNSLKFESENDNYIWTIANKGATSCGAAYFCYTQDYFE